MTNACFGAVKTGFFMSAAVLACDRSKTEGTSARQQSSELTGNHRTTEKMALPLGAAVLLKKNQLIPCFHTFRHNPHMQTFPHANHGADDTGIVSIRSEIAHEGLIDFQSIDRKALQVA